MYYKFTTVAGKTIEVRKSYCKSSRPKKTNYENLSLSPEQIEKINEANAKRKATREINANFKGGDYHLVLTYKKELRPTPKFAKKYIKKFLRALRKEYKKIGSELKYFQVTEYKNKAIHHHLVINSVEGVSIDKVVNRLWNYGRVKFSILDDTGQYKQLAEYLIKETSKTFREKDGGQMQRWSCSKNLIIPKPKVEKINAKTWSDNPKPKKGYYIEKDSVYNGTNPFTGGIYQRYTMIKLPVGKKVQKNERNGRGTDNVRKT
ncbi:MAG: hypothetical protein LKJ25_06015 [Clostridia bacterium]|jgi:hypothetical protein|nr:hypothetical protein [Clostridia bacterium]